MHEDDYIIQGNLLNTVIFLVQPNQDVMYYNHTTKASDVVQLSKSRIKKVTVYINNQNWRLFPRGQVTKHYDVIPSVQTMKKKRDINTGNQYKYNTRLM